LEQIRVLASLFPGRKRRLENASVFGWINCLLARLQVDQLSLFATPALEKLTTGKPVERFPLMHVRRALEIAKARIVLGV